MKKVIGLVFVAALMATPAMAQKVTIDYAHDFDFKSVKTFQYVDTPETNAKSELMADRIASMIKKELTEGGLTEVTENPDIYVTYHIATQDRHSFTTTGFGYGGYPYWGGVGYETRIREYDEGMLIVDIIDVASDKLIWRGTGTRRVTEQSDPEKTTRVVNQTVAEILSQFPPQPK